MSVRNRQLHKHLATKPKKKTRYFLPCQIKIKNTERESLTQNQR